MSWPTTPLAPSASTGGRGVRLTRAVAAGCLALAAAVGLSACGAAGGSSGTGPGAKVSGTTLTIYSSLPEQGAAGARGKAIENGAKLAARAAGKIGRYTIAYKPLDDSPASSGTVDSVRAVQNAHRARADKSAVGYVGDYESGASQVTIPILDEAGLAQISPSNTYAGLTINGPGSLPGEPARYYPTGKRNYARVVPPDTVQAAALAQSAKRAGCSSIEIWSSQTAYGAGLARDLALAAPKLGLKVAGNDRIDPKAASYRSLAAKIGADCLVYAGEIESNGTRVLADAGGAKPRLQLFAGDADCLDAVASALPPALARRFHCTIATADPKTVGLARKKFLADYSSAYGGSAPDPYAVYGYEAMALMLDSVKRASSDGTKDVTRQGVVDAIFETRNRSSVLGTYSIDMHGDISLTGYGLYGVAGRKIAFQRVVK